MSLDVLTGIWAANKAAEIVGDSGGGSRTVTIDLNKWGSNRGDMSSEILFHFMQGGGAFEAEKSYLFWALNGLTYENDDNYDMPELDDALKNSGIFNQKNAPLRVVVCFDALGVAMDTVSVTKTFEAGGGIRAISIPWSFDYEGVIYKVFLTLIDAGGHGNTTVSVELL